MKIAIYGAGAYGKAFFNALQENNMQVDCFIDQYTKKDDYLNLPIFKTEEIDNKNIEVYISVSLNDNNIIPNILKNNGYKNIYSFTNSLKKINTILPNLMKTNILWMRENNTNFLDIKKLDKFQNLLTDTKSKNILENIVKFRQTLDMQFYISPDKQIQYFPDDINLFSKINTIKLIDCGAFVGDTIISTMKYSIENNIKIDSIISFEADEQNIEKLNFEVKKQKEAFLDTNFIIYPAGIWSKNTILNFSNVGNSASAICNSTNENSIQIPVFNLDSTLLGLKPNYIKMDIEGAEQEAIRGGVNIIKENSPILAISIYHTPEDLYQIPLLINSRDPNYDMHLRVYGHLGLEIILYCVPKDI